MVKDEFKTLDGKMFNLAYNEKQNKVVLIEYEHGVDPEKLRSLHAYNFINRLHYLSIIKKLIPCQKI